MFLSLQIFVAQIPDPAVTPSVSTYRAVSGIYKEPLALSMLGMARFSSLSYLHVGTSVHISLGRGLTFVQN